MIMLYMPGFVGENLMNRIMDDWDRDFFGGHHPLYGYHAQNLMKTDVREHEDCYEVDIDLPGFAKEDLNLSLENGYLTIQAQKGLNKEQKDEKTGKILRQERYAGSMSRSFYVGEDITEEDIKAKLENGVLSLQVPKLEAKPRIPEKKTITIEG